MTIYDHSLSDHRDVIVPYLPTANDMVLVQGEDVDPEPWDGRVTDYDERRGVVSVRFYIRKRYEMGIWINYGE